MQRAFFLLLLTGLFLASLGCAQKESAEYQDSTYIIIENVPFIKQRDKYCGPSAMASVLNFYGRDVSQAEIADAIYIPELNGALISDMENYAVGKGYVTQSTNGNIEELKKNIDKGIPVIVLADKGRWKVSVPHYYVVIGYNDKKETFILHTGYSEKEEISYPQLNREWDRMNNLMLVITE